MSPLVIFKKHKNITCLKKKKIFKKSLIKKYLTKYHTPLFCLLRIVEYAAGYKNKKNLN